MATDFELGVLIGILLGEGHFGGDGRQAQVTLRMHVRHAALFRWLERTFPGGRLYGPYHHGGRDYYQWMARGAFLRDELVPLLARGLASDIDTPSFERFHAMVERYHLPLADGDVAHAPRHRPEADAASPTADELPGNAGTSAGRAATDRLSALFDDLRRTGP